MKLRKVWIIPAGVVFILLAVVVAALWQVDDWSRDFHTNHAETANNSSNENLRPIQANLSPSELADLVVKAVEKLPHWQLVDNQADEREALVTLTRSTRWLRFKDDISVHIAASPMGSTLHAESQSRIGKGDLGQNPRNLTELLILVRLLLAEPAQ